MTERQT